MTCIENMAWKQQLNYQSHSCRNRDMLIKTFDLWWLKLSEVPQNPASIPSSIYRKWFGNGWLRLKLATPSWPYLAAELVGRGSMQGLGWLCYQGQILEAWESVAWILLVVTHTYSLLTDWARPSDSWLLITEDTKHECSHQSEDPRKAK